MAETVQKKKAHSGPSARKPQAHSATAKGRSTAPSAAHHTKTVPKTTTSGPGQSTKAATTASHGKSTGRGKGRAAAAAAKVNKPHGQQGIDAERAREIQAALIREKYLAGEPTGSWDAETRQAMVRYQNDHGWQTRVTPDSRALIMLGLGPTHAGLINPASISESIPTGARDMRPGGAAFSNN